MKQKSVGMTLRALIIALVLSLVAGSPALPPFDGVAYAQSTGTGLTATVAPGGASVGLSWTAVAGADSYEVWRGDGAGTGVQWGSSALATVTAPAVTYTDSAVTAGMTYSYAVRAVTGGTPAAFAGPYPRVDIPGGTAKPTERPTVTVAAVDGDNTAADVSWTSVAGATSYEIGFWHSDLDDWDYDLPATTSMSYRHNGLMAGTEYYYVVRGVNDGGMGPWSRWQEGTSKITLQGTSATPTLDLTHPSRTVVELSWTPAPAGSTYTLQRRKITTDSADPPVSFPADTTSGWATLPNAGSLTSTSYTDSAANYVPHTAAEATTLTLASTPITVKYEYRVRAVDSDNVQGDWSNVKMATIPEAGAVVGMPTISVAAVSSSSTRVTWAAVAGAAFYELQWKSGDGNYNTPFRVNSSPYEHGNLSPSTKYTYQVRAVDINGAGDWSAEKSTTTHSVTAAAGQMPKVTGLTVTDVTDATTDTTRKAKLTWNAVSGVTHYEIQRFNVDGGAWGDPEDTDDLVDGVLTKDNAGSPPTWTDTITSADAAAGEPLKGAGQTYYYVVSAVNEGITTGLTDGDEEMGEWSDYKSVTFVDYKPLAPLSSDAGNGALTAAKTNGGSILIDWMQPPVVRASQNGMATSWTLRWRHEDTTTWSSIAVTGDSSYHHTGLSGNTTYYYRVRAENAGGMSDWTDIVEVTLGNALTAPRNVRAVDATTATAAAIKVSWTAVPGADSYEIQRFGDDRTWGDLADDSTGATPYASVTGTEVTDDGDNDPATNTGTALAAGKTYLYRVRMEKEGVRSGWSAVASGTTRAAAPDVPTLSATTTGQSMIRLSWTATAGATAYHLEFLEGEQGHDEFEDPNTNPTRRTISGNFRHYVHTGLKAGTQYSYRLRAVLPSGNGDWTSAGASPQEVEPWTKPAPPDLTATATDSTTIRLTWDAVSVGGTRLTAAENYRVEWRLRNSGDAWATLGTGEDITCADNKCMVDDAALTANMHYQYRIRTEAPAANDSHKSYWDYTNQRTPAASTN